MTDTAFDTTDASGVAVTLSGTAIGTVDTDIAGDIVALNLSNGGSGYSVDDTVTINEDGGAGVGSARVASIS